jgi:hypothetical protein
MFSCGVAERPKVRPRSGSRIRLTLPVCGVPASELRSRDMHVRSVEESDRKRVQNSIRAYLNGEKNSHGSQASFAVLDFTRTRVVLSSATELTVRVCPISRTGSPTNQVCQGSPEALRARFLHSLSAISGSSGLSILLPEDGRN